MVRIDGEITVADTSAEEILNRLNKILSDSRLAVIPDHEFNDIIQICDEVKSNCEKGDVAEAERLCKFVVDLIHEEEAR